MNIIETAAHDFYSKNKCRPKKCWINPVTLSGLLPKGDEDLIMSNPENDGALFSFMGIRIYAKESTPEGEVILE
jgi:hypothetical protein